MNILDYKTIFSGFLLLVSVHLLVYLSTFLGLFSPYSWFDFYPLNSLIVLSVFGLFFYGGLKSNKKKTYLIKKSRWMGIHCTMGKIPHPTFSKARKKIKINGTFEHKILAEEALSLIASHKKSWAGPGRGTLYQHTINIFKLSLGVEKADPLLPVIAILHDIGKIWSYEKTTSGYRKIAEHTELGGLWLASNPYWQNLRDPDRSIIACLVRLHHSSYLPEYKNIPLNRLLILKKQLNEIDGQSARGEKETTLKGFSKDELLLKVGQAFENLLKNIILQGRGTPKGMTTHGYKKDNRLYLLEKAVQQDCLNQMEIDYKAVLIGDAFTEHLLDFLKNQGCLIGRVENIKATNGLFSIKSGKKKMNGVMIVRIDPDNELFKSVLDKPDTSWDITVIATNP